MAIIIDDPYGQGKTPYGEQVGKGFASNLEKLAQRKIEQINQHYDTLNALKIKHAQERHDVQKWIDLGFSPREAQIYALYEKHGTSGSLGKLTESLQGMPQQGQPQYQQQAPIQQPQNNAQSFLGNETTMPTAGMSPESAMPQKKMFKTVPLNKEEKVIPKRSKARSEASRNWAEGKINPTRPFTELPFKGMREKDMALKALQFDKDERTKIHKSKKLDASIVDIFLNKTGNDPKKAREMAKRFGFEV